MGSEWEFTGAYKLNREVASRESIEDNPVARALILLVDSGEKFVGTATQLLDRLEFHACSESKLKQHPKWTVDQLPDGTFRWTTPAGRTYDTEPTRYPI